LDLPFGRCEVEDCEDDEADGLDDEDCEEG
jgi:hypothetical protein